MHADETIELFHRLAYVGFANGLTGILLWPLVIVHGTLMTLLIRASTSSMETTAWSK
jgi:hypothetical protein